MAAGRHIDQLKTGELSWRDLWVIVGQTHPNTSAVHRARNPDDWMWGLPELLAASMLDELRWLKWTKTKDAGKKSNPPPEPTIRPGVNPKKPAQMRVGDAMTQEEFDRRYAAKLAAAS